MDDKAEKKAQEEANLGQQSIKNMCCDLLVVNSQRPSQPWERLHQFHRLSNTKGVYKFFLPVTQFQVPVIGK